MTREEAIRIAAAAIKTQIMLDYNEPMNEETSRRIDHELEKIYAVAQIHAMIVEREEAAKLRMESLSNMLKGEQ